MKLKFLKDTYYGDKLFAKEGEIKEVSEELGFAARWIKRGAQVVSEQQVAVKEAVVKEEPKKEEPAEKVEVVEEEKAVDNKSGKKIKGHRVG